MTDPPFVLTDADDADAATWGGKGAALTRLAAAGLPVPPLVAVPPAAFHASLTDAHRAALAASAEGSLDPEGLGDALADLASSPAVAEALAEALGAMGGRVAVRSSAPDEDGAQHAFAGQLESFLNVAPADVAARVADVWRSAFAPRVWAYRSARGIDGPPQPPAVVIQAMVDAQAAGVAFTADPVSGRRDVAVVAAVRGLATTLVDGRADAETVTVDRAGHVVTRTPGRQTLADRVSDDGVEVCLALGGPVLTAADAARVAALARRAQASLGGAPQDVEWALDREDRLWLVQSRPITTLVEEGGKRTEEREEIPAPRFPLPAPDVSRVRLWDNSNIVESYGGVTSTLTFSFARRAYEAVYREFCRLLGVPEARVEAEADTFAAMIGRVRGRVFYNLGNWYRVLALLPGYRLNAPLMEGMMGVKEPIPAHLKPEPAAVGKLADALGLARSVAGLVWAHVRLPAMQRAFRARLDRVLAPVDLDAMPLDALADHYRYVERELLTKWDAPLVNDFFAMIWFGVAGQLADRWIAPGALGGLLAGDGDVISAEPARRVGAMARLAVGDAPLVDALRTGDAEAVQAAVDARPAIAALGADYLERFGDRCLEELKLESPTLADDPLPLWRAVGATAARPDGATAGADGVAAAAAQRAGAEAERMNALARHPLRRLVFGFVLRHARGRVRDRENLRFERTRVFGRARRIVRAMSTHLADAGRLESADDVFHLDLAELLGACDGTGTTADLTGLAAVRRAETDAYRAGDPPPDRFTTTGAVALSPLTDSSAPAAGAPAGEVRTGLGCCPGVVEGPVRVVRDPRGVTLAPGTILVAERTDPGWILLFPACAGLVVERGSLLSHSAIVARELGLPAAVSVPGVTAWLADGDRVRLDGATGRVERLEGGKRKEERGSG